MRSVVLHTWPYSLVLRWYERLPSDFITVRDILFVVLKRTVFASKEYPFKNIFDFTTAGDWDCVAAVEHFPALHYSVDFIFMLFGIMGFIVEL